MIKDWVLDQESSHPDQQNVESDWPWDIPYSDMNGAQSNNGTQSSGLNLDFASTGLSDAGHWPDFFLYPQYDMMNTGDGNHDVEGRSPTKTTTQDVQELGAYGNEEAGHQKSSPGLAVSTKRVYVDCSPREAKRQRRNKSLGLRKSPVATPVSFSPAHHLSKRGHPSISLLSGSLLKNLVRGHGLRNHKTTYLFNRLDEPAETQEVQKSRKLVSKIRRGSNDWTIPTGDAVGEVAKALTKLSMTV